MPYAQYFWWETSIVGWGTLEMATKSFCIHTFLGTSPVPRDVSPVLGVSETRLQVQEMGLLVTMVNTKQFMFPRYNWDEAPSTKA